MSRLAATFLAVWMGAGPISAQETNTQTETVTRWRQLGGRGSVRGSLWSSSRTLDDRGLLLGIALWGEASPRLGSRARLFVEGWIAAPDLSDPGNVDGELREIYVDTRLGPVDLRVGKQIVAWGRADGLNPTDNLTPRDFTRLMPDDDDQRVGMPGLRATAYLGSMSFSALWLGRFEGHEFPFPAMTSIELVKRQPDNEAEQFAVKLERVGGTADWSVSYFVGFDQLPDLAMKGSPGDGTRVAVDLAHHRVHVFGADATGVVGRFGVRAEAAYTLTEDRQGADPEIKNPAFLLVCGADRTFFAYLYINVQYVFRAVNDFASPDLVPDPARRQVAVQLATISHQLRPRQHGATFRISNKWRHETLEAAAEAVFLASPRQTVIRPRVSYAVTDRWKVLVGGELFRGASSTLFGQLRQNSTFYTEIQFGF